MLDGFNNVSSDCSAVTNTEGQLFPADGCTIEELSKLDDIRIFVDSSFVRTGYAEEFFNIWRGLTVGAGEEKYMDTLENLLMNHPDSENFDFIRSDKDYYEILPKGACKGNLVAKLAEILGIDMKYTISAGDNDNDISMLETTAVSFAVANASPLAKAAANHHTVSNEEHAIAKIIDELDKGNIKF